jgi:MraZ protein
MGYNGETWEKVGVRQVMFFGEFEYRIDEKGRIPFPPRFRPAFKDGIVLSAGIEKCLNIYTSAEWKKYADSLASSNLSASKLRAINRAVFAQAFFLALDAQGRLSLPANLRAYAGLGEDVVIAGVNNCLELWDKAGWAAAKQESQAQAWQITESLERR